jgi:hypothetical protein
MNFAGPVQRLSKDLGEKAPSCGIVFSIVCNWRLPARGEVENARFTRYTEQGISAS